MNQRGNRLRPATAVLLVAGSCVAMGLASTRAFADEEGKFSFNGRIYADVTSKENKDKGTGIKSDDSGIGTDVKRLYLEFGYKVDDVWSAKFVSDIGDHGAKRYDVFVKKAYLEGKFSKLAVLQVGSSDEPWIPFIEGLYGYRYLENTLTDRQGFGTSADWGVHMKGDAEEFSYSVGVVNGRGYSDPTRSKTVDFEGRVAFVPVKGLTLGLGGYAGKLGQDTDTVPALHTAKRYDAVVNYRNDHFNLGGEYFKADDWKTVASMPTDSSDGVSVWASVPVSKVELFARYDRTRPSKDLNPDLKSTYFNAGVQFKPATLLLVAVAYKHDTVDSGLGGSAAGVGSVLPDSKGEQDEVGVWTQYKW